MQRFYSTLTQLNFFTLSANSLLVNQPCPHCQCTDQWVSHGFSYNQSGEIRGKRIVCCARFGKRGCGKTVALYLASILPKRRYQLIALFQFISSLVQGNTVEKAYFSAIGHQHSSGRQAYRWLKALSKKLGEFRVISGSRPVDKYTVQHRSRRLSTLLSTLKQTLFQWPNLTHYQVKYNQAFC